ncbi:MAG: hypothetical protein KZQ83_16840 [gamma proteobacterium symbiont of Taylorina sp.]|nr:hypothetical protein [gamma proteobacterium symbiont of Taylorina sp.]
MKPVTATFTMCYSIHKDGWTETLEGLRFLVKQIEELEKGNNNINCIYLLRIVFISSSYLVEQVFTQSIENYCTQILSNESNETSNKLTARLMTDWKENNSIRKVGISRAIKEWPEILTGKKLDLSCGSLQAMRIITKKRNDIIHKLNDFTNYSQPYEIAKSVLYTSVEACKEIEKHFFPESEFSYQEWVDTYPIEQAEHIRQNTI